MAYASISLQPLLLFLNGDDQEGRLILVDGKLAAVLARLDSEAHPAELLGQWSLEAGFGPCDPGGREFLFDTPDEAARWAADRVANGAASADASYRKLRSTSVRTTGAAEASSSRCR